MTPALGVLRQRKDRERRRIRSEQEKGDEVLRTSGEMSGAVLVTIVSPASTSSNLAIQVLRNHEVKALKELK
jgi:hypothetical protein